MVIIYSQFTGYKNLKYKYHKFIPTVYLKQSKTSQHQYAQYIIVGPSELCVLPLGVATNKLTPPPPAVGKFNTLSIIFPDCI
jgi:hypothetical protein